MRASGGPALEGAPAAGGVYHASQMRPRLPAERGPQATLFHPFLRLDARTGSLRLPATICSSNFRDRTLGRSVQRVGMEGWAPDTTSSARRRISSFISGCVNT
jgi:hypothetical protein